MARSLHSFVRAQAVREDQDARLGMRESLKRTIFVLALVAAMAPASTARADSTASASSLPTKRPAPRSSIFQIDDGRPKGAYFKVGRFAAAEAAETNPDRRSLQASLRGVATLPSVDRTFMTIEAGAKRVGVRGFVSAPGQSRTGELEPQLGASLYRRIERVGPATNLLASASAGTGSSDARRYYAYSSASRLSLGPLSLLGHAAVVDTEISRGFKRSWSARAEAGFRVTELMDTKLAYEWLDPNAKRRGDEYARIGLRIDPVLEHNIKVGVAYRNIGDSRVGPSTGAHEIAFELNATF